MGHFLPFIGVLLLWMFFAGKKRGASSYGYRRRSWRGRSYATDRSVENDTSEEMEGVPEGLPSIPETSTPTTAPQAAPTTRRDSRIPFTGAIAPLAPLAPLAPRSASIARNALPPLQPIARKGQSS